MAIVTGVPMDQARFCVIQNGLVPRGAVIGRARVAVVPCESCKLRRLRARIAQSAIDRTTHTSRMLWLMTDLGDLLAVVHSAAQRQVSLKGRLQHQRQREVCCQAAYVNPVNPIPEWLHVPGRRRLTAELGPSVLALAGALWFTSPPRSER